MTLNVALTGSIAAGKSTVAELWAARDVPVASADTFARRAVEPGTHGFDRVREAFGDEVVGIDGTLDRAALRARVFRDEEARAKLEAIIHPSVREQREQWFAEQEERGHELAVSEIPLLFETGGEEDFDVTVLVDAPEAVRLARLVSDRGIDEAEARRMMDAQMPAEEKRARSDIVIDNGASLDAIRERADRVLDDLRARARSELRMDLHLHTMASWDCLSDPEAVLRRMRALGYGRIAITDHDRLGLALRMAERHPEAIVPGEEVRTAEGIDVIGLYLSEEIPRGTPAEKTIAWIHEQGGISYLPHPYAGGKGGGGRLADRLASLCEVVEVFNARLHHPTANPRAEDLADRHGTLRGAGSDAHTLRELGNAFVELPAHANRPDALRNALRHARVGGTEASRLVHLASTWAKVRKKLPGGGAP
ncbi:MAG: dephospho-CoA kinase [Gemmatimonadota bacterium]|nr:dephospho-CoA kinase [Gemmatimonadota bacterium]